MSKKQHQGPYDSPVFSKKVALLMFRFCSSWVWFWIFTLNCVYHIYKNWAIWNTLSPMDKFNVELSILAPALEIVMLMAQKAVAEYDRSLIHRSAVMAEKLFDLVLSQHQLMIKLLLKENHGDLVTEADRNLAAVDLDEAERMLIPEGVQLDDPGLLD